MTKIKIQFIMNNEINEIEHENASMHVDGSTIVVNEKDGNRYTYPTTSVLCAIKERNED